MWWCTKCPNPRSHKKWAKRCGTHPFYRKFWWDTHAQWPRRCQPLLPSGRLMAALGATICMMYTKCSAGNQACMGLTTVAKQPGQENGGHPFTTTYIWKLLQSHIWDLHSHLTWIKGQWKKRIYSNPPLNGKGLFLGNDLGRLARCDNLT